MDEERGASIGVRNGAEQGSLVLDIGRVDVHAVGNEIGELGSKQILDAILLLQGLRLRNQNLGLVFKTGGLSLA